MKIKHAQYYLETTKMVSSGTLTEPQGQGRLYKFFKGQKAFDKAKVKDIQEHAAYLNELFITGEIPVFERIIKIKGVQYGLEPSIDDMASGAFLGADTLVQGDADQNLHKIIALLYRPITLKIGKRYEISSYTKEPKEDVEDREALFFHEFDYHHALGVVNHFWTST